MSLSSAAPHAASASDRPTGASQQTGATSASRGQGGLDVGGKAWAAQLLLLVMQAYTVMGDADLPDWISRLIKGPSDRDLIPGACLLAWCWLHLKHQQYAPFGCAWVGYHLYTYQHIHHMLHDSPYLVRCCLEV